MQEKQTSTIGGQIAGRAVVDISNAALLDVRRVANLLGCSSRTVYRLADAGRMPRPVKLGALVRWSRSAIQEWIADGCPSCRRSQKGVS